MNNTQLLKEPYDHIFVLAYFQQVVYLFIIFKCFYYFQVFIIFKCFNYFYFVLCFFYSTRQFSLELSLTLSSQQKRDVIWPLIFGF